MRARRTAWLCSWLIVAVWAISIETPSVSHRFTADEIALLMDTPIGQTVEIREPRGDGCNTCGHVYRRVSETDVEDLGPSGCTAMYCYRPPPVYRFAPEPATPPAPQEEP